MKTKGYMISGHNPKTGRVTNKHQPADGQFYGRTAAQIAKMFARDDFFVHIVVPYHAGHLSVNNFDEDQGEQA
jgi:hypothetical protein